MINRWRLCACTIERQTLESLRNITYAKHRDSIHSVATLSCWRLRHPPVLCWQMDQWRDLAADWRIIAGGPNH